MIIPRSFRLILVTGFISLGALVAQAQQTRTWLMLNLTSQETFFVTDPAEQTRLAKAGWKTNGEGTLLAKAQSNTAAMHRLVKSTEKGVDRVFAISAEDSATATKGGYHDEGVLGQVSATQLVPAMIPVYHFTKDTRNLWLINKADQPWAEKSGWTLKGVAFWVWPKTAP